VSGSLHVPTSEAAFYEQSWETVAPASTLALNAGSHIVRIVNEADPLDLNEFCLTAQQARSPFEGTAWPVPGTIEAENYDLGGEGVGYHDADCINNLGPLDPMVLTSNPAPMRPVAATRWALLVKMNG
jgi:hypothetical protein